MDDLEYKLRNHLLTAFVGDKIFNEEDNSFHHNEAMLNISYQLLKDKIYFNFEYEDPLPEFSWKFLSLGYVLVANISTELSKLFIIFIPETYTTEQKEIIKNCINVLDEGTVLLQQKDGEKFLTLDIEDINIKNHNKQM